MRRTFGDGLEVLLYINPLTQDEVFLEGEISIKDGGEGEQWIIVGAINVSITEDKNVFLAWDSTQVRLRGTVKYIVYTSDTLTKPLKTWDLIEEAKDLEKEYISVERNLTRNDVEWHEATMLNFGKDKARFFRVKAVVRVE